MDDEELEGFQAYIALMQKDETFKNELERWECECCETEDEEAIKRQFQIYKDLQDNEH